MIDTSWIEPHLRVMRRFDYALIAIFGWDVFMATLNIVEPFASLWLQVFGVVINIAAAVWLWEVVKSNERKRAHLLDYARRVSEFNRIFP